MIEISDPFDVLLNLQFTKETNRILKVKGRGLHTVHEPPVEERVVHKGLQYGHQTVLVFPQYLHHTLTGHLIVTVDTCHLATHI